MESFEMNCFLTQGIPVKFPASLRPSTIFPRILWVGGLILESFLSQCSLHTVTPPTTEEMMVHPEEVEDLSNGVVDEIVNGLWMKVKGRDRRK